MLKRILSLGLIIICMLSSGCGTTKGQATGVGAGIGAGIGAVVGAIVGDDLGAAIGAGVGGLVGAVGGYAYGTYVDQINKKYSQQEDTLDNRIQRVQEINTATSQYNQALEKEIAELDQKVNIAKSQYHQNQTEKESLETLQSQIQQKHMETEEQIKLAELQIVDLKKNLTKFNDAKEKDELAKLNQEISRLEQLVSRMKLNTQALASINQKITL